MRGYAFGRSWQEIAGETPLARRPRLLIVSGEPQRKNVSSPLSSHFGGWWPFTALAALTVPGIFARLVHLITLTGEKNVQSVPNPFCQSRLRADSFRFARRSFPVRSLTGGTRTESA
jgi:hypothetical protein